MSKRITVEYTWCGTCGKRGFHTTHDAAKALGKAQAKRDRVADRHGTRRGITREHRSYNGCPEGLYHLTHWNRRQVKA